MPITRIVRVNGFGLGGCSITVTFRGVNFHVCDYIATHDPRVNVEFSPINKECQITAFEAFVSAEQGQKWIDDITNRVKASSCFFDHEYRHEFKALEGESTI